MTDRALPVVAWLATYALHSTVLLGAALLIARRVGPVRTHSARAELLLRVALVGSLATSLLQAGTGWGPRLAVLEARGLEPRAVVRSAATPDPGTGARLQMAAPAPGATAARATAAVPAAPMTGLAAPATGLAAPATRVARWPIAILAVWLGGAALGLVRLAVGFRGLRRRLRPRRSLEAGPERLALDRLEAASGRGRSVRLSAGALLPAPVSFGILRPEIALPDRALRELDPRERDALLAHELAHVLRRDPAWQLAASLLAAVFFWQPLVRNAQRRLAGLAEDRCDAWAARRSGGGLDLARCLTRVATWLRPSVELPVPQMAEPRSDLARRVARLTAVRTPERDPHRAWLAAALSGTLLVALALPGVAVASPGADGPGAEIETTVASGGPAGDRIDGLLGVLIDEIDRLRQDARTLRERVRATELEPCHGAVLDDIDRRLRLLRDRCERIRDGRAVARTPTNSTRESTGATE